MLGIHGDMIVENLRIEQEDFLGCSGKKIAYQGGMDFTPEEFERCFVEMVTDEIGEGNWSTAATIIFGKTDKSTAASIFRQLRNQSKKGKPRKLSLSEAVTMAKYINKDFSYYCHLVTQKLKEKPKDHPNKCRVSA